MPVRLKIALTILVTGLLTAVGVITTVLYAFERFERESTYYRAAGFLERVVAEHVDMLGMQERFPDEFNSFLRNLVLFEPDSQLYLLGMDGRVLAMSGDAKLPDGFKVNMGPVKEASGPVPMPYVMGDDPQRMDANAVVAARVLSRKAILNQPEAAGYLYLVCHKTVLSQSSVAALQGSFVQPTLVLILIVVAVSSLLAAWVAASITRPLSQMSAAVSHITRDGLGDAQIGQTISGDAYLGLPTTVARDEFGQLNNALRSMLDALRQQWSTLRRLDHFRREGVSNLSHDLRSPLTATTACLETLDARWSSDETRDTDRQLLEVALRNTRNASRLVQSLGELAQLDEPTFKLQTELMDVSELLDDVGLRFAERAAQLGVQWLSHCEQVCAKVDVELFERAIANLLDNALKYTKRGDIVRVGVRQVDEEAHITVEDTGAGIAASDLPHLFDRFYQVRQSVAPATGEGGKGLGLAIVKRIVELHGGQVSVVSEPGRGTTIHLSLPSIR